MQEIALLVRIKSQHHGQSLSEPIKRLWRGFLPGASLKKMICRSILMISFVILEYEGNMLRCAMKQLKVAR